MELYSYAGAACRYNQAMMGRCRLLGRECTSSASSPAFFSQKLRGRYLLPLPVVSPASTRLLVLCPSPPRIQVTRYLPKESRCAVVLICGRWQRTVNLVPAYPPSFSLPRLGTSVAVSSLPDSQASVAPRRHPLPPLAISSLSHFL